LTDKGTGKNIQIFVKGITPLK
jgi:hypothetical protein